MRQQVKKMVVKIRSNIIKEGNLCDETGGRNM